jgi:hypothetical protein
LKRIVGAMAVVVVAAASLLSVSVHGAGAAEIGTEAAASGDVSFGDLPNVMSATYQIPTRMTFNVGPDERISIKQGQAACAAGQSQYLSTSATQTVETTTISFDVLGFGDSFLCGFEPSTFQWVVSFVGSWQGSMAFDYVQLPTLGVSSWVAVCNQVRIPTDATCTGPIKPFGPAGTSVTFGGNPPVPQLSCHSSSEYVGLNFDDLPGPYHLCSISGDPVPSIKVVSGSLPPGVTVSVQNGAVALHGIAKVVGHYSFGLVAGNGRPPDANAVATFDVSKCLAQADQIDWSQPAPGEPVVLQGHFDNANCPPATGQMSFLIHSNNPWTDLERTVTVSASGRGQVTASLLPGSYTAVARYSGDQDHEPWASRELSFVVPPTPAPILSCQSNGVAVGWDFDQYAPYTSHLCSISGSPAPNLKVIAGSLPPGVTLSVERGEVILHGTATVAGRYSFTLEADNGTHPVATSSVSFDVGQ